MKHKKTVFLCFVLLMWSCIAFGKEPYSDPPELPASDSTGMDVVWHRYYHADSTGGEEFLNPVVWREYVIVASTYNGNANTKQRGVRIFHKHTGEDHFAWRSDPDGVVDRNDGLDDFQIGGANGDILFVGNSNGNLYAIDLNSKQRLWKTSLKPQYQGIFCFSMLESSPLQVYYPSGGGLSTSWCRIAKCNPVSGERTTLVDVSIEDNYEFRLRPAAWMVNPAGDTVLLFLRSGWDFSLSQGNMQAYCYNVTQKKTEWKKENFVEGGDASYHIPTIVANRYVIFAGLRNMHCFDIATGELVWQYLPVPMQSYSETRPLYADGKLFLRSTSGKVTCLDAQTGQIVWEAGGVSDASGYVPAPGGAMDIYQGKLYLTAWGPDVTFYLYCLDAQTGKMLWKDRGPSKKIAHGITIDQQTGYLYCMTDWSVMCVNLNTPYPVEH